ncbi:MAG: DUF1697 domain-containing protein [Thiovulaceae bacterium]|nr:DUF1697 domain-containing protein [Sulfurimonadaceae bacterium]
MNDYIILLRGINVGGKNRIKMQELISVLQEHGFDKVRTYIQSGNIVLKSKELKAEIIARTIHKAIEEHFNCDIPVLTFDAGFLERTIENNPTQRDRQELYYTFLFNHADTTLANAIEGVSKDQDSFKIDGAVVYIDCLAYGKTKFNNNYFEKKLMSHATTRNYKTLKKLLELVNGQ